MGEIFFRQKLNHTIWSSITSMVFKTYYVSVIIIPGSEERKGWLICAAADFRIMVERTVFPVICSNVSDSRKGE